mmetsp:Transcript_34274/g.102740  ORF Transcript_34274/g.102740 Transcript_34274/m.102740 type:complete len:229 (-) Transcript_34274:781-1467(-)
MGWFHDHIGYGGHDAAHRRRFIPPQERFDLDAAGRIHAGAYGQRGGCRQEPPRSDGEIDGAPVRPVETEGFLHDGRVGRGEDNGDDRRGEGDGLTGLARAGGGTQGGDGEIHVAVVGSGSNAPHADVGEGQTGEHGAQIGQEWIDERIAVQIAHVEFPPRPSAQIGRQCDESETGSRDRQGVPYGSVQSRSERAQRQTQQHTVAGIIRQECRRVPHVRADAVGATHVE